MKKRKVIIRTGKVIPNTSMENYLQNCILPLAYILLENGYKVVFQTNVKTTDFDSIAFRLQNRRGPFHILGMLFDELQIAFHTLFTKDQVLILNMNQLLPNILCAKNTIMIIHDIMPLEYPAHWPLLHKYYKYYLGPLLKRCRAIISVSNTTKRKLQEFYNLKEDKIITIYNGIKFSIKEEDVTTKMNVEEAFIYIGADLPNKNLRLLTDVFAELDERYSLNMISGCCNNKDVTAAAAINSNIKLMGYISEEELKQQYLNCKALVYPSFSEGFGLPLIEAMWYGKTIIVADKDYAREVCEDYPAIYFENNKQLKNAIVMSQEYSANLDLVKVRKDLTSKFSWDKARQSIFNVLDNIMK
ncbi:glycosyltransferase family 4 protein [Cohnella hashimotonis]|uniref:Glycosyltransferase family 1 protein n=1 Tax=Cohnella hashimotonis TaxID=2826895 RepID=A0ABT6TUU8_9BACL|nr:glycosyltransferase family 1 protein [Cohnella hashimotonis]MDI4650326.1 glycosyltransferase family 1 protein [Cohnella hashimotonis]